MDSGGGRSPEDGNDASNDPPTVGDQLAELINRAAVMLPDAAAQRNLADTTLRAMLDGASSEMADAFDSLSVNLSAVERNVSSSLVENLEGSEKLSRLNRVLDTIQIDSASGRQAVQADLAALREAEEEMRNATEQGAGALWVSGWGREDAWWQSRLAAGGPFVTSLNFSAALLGALLIVAALDVAMGGGPLELAGFDARGGLVLAWRGGFVGGLVAYLVSLAALTQRSGE